MSIYSQPFAVEYKAGREPADGGGQGGPRGDRSGAGASHSRYPGVVGRVLPEVMAARLGWSRYWLVDPLDGTKEFVSRNGEFTVNIALIEQGTPRWGWSMPRYWTSSGMGARGLAPGVWLMAGTRPSRPALMTLGKCGAWWAVAITCRRKPSSIWPVLANWSGARSSWFPWAALSSFASLPRGGRALPAARTDLRVGYGGSSGGTGRGGGSVTQLDGSPLCYNKPDILNPWFVARA